MSDPIDREFFQRATFGDRTLQRDLLTLFGEQAGRLGSILAAGANEGSARAAHTLKGSARGIGAVALANAADDFERNANAEALLRLRDALDAAREQAARMLSEG
jgi:HPt (histidine-containing phosphotransfer) domain-containing protein